MARSLVIVESPQRRKRLTNIWGGTTPSKRHRPRDGPAQENDWHSSAREERRQEEEKKQSQKGKQENKGSGETAGKLISIDDDKIFEPTLQIICGQRQSHQ